MLLDSNSRLSSGPYFGSYRRVGVCVKLEKVAGETRVTLGGDLEAVEAAHDTARGSQHDAYLSHSPKLL